MKALHVSKAVLFVTLLTSQPGWSTADLGVDRIMQLRLEIEAKNNEWESKNKALQVTTDTLLQRASELEAQNAKAKAGLALMRARVEAGESRLLRRQTLSTNDRDRLIATLAKVETQFKTRLPFLSAKALEETARIRAALSNKQMSTDEAAQSLAMLLKSELKAARGLRLERTQMTFDGVRREVEVVRLGEYSAIAAVPEGSGDLSYRQISAGRTEWSHLSAVDDIENVERIFSAARTHVANAPVLIAWPLAFGAAVTEN